MVTEINNERVVRVVSVERHDNPEDPLYYLIKLAKLEEVIERQAEKIIELDYLHYANADLVACECPTCHKAFSKTKEKSTFLIGKRKFQKAMLTNMVLRCPNGHHFYFCNLLDANRLGSIELSRKRKQERLGLKNK